MLKYDFENGRPLMSMLYNHVVVVFGLYMMHSFKLEYLCQNILAFCHTTLGFVKLNMITISGQCFIY